jgi:hypothetical protein
VGIAAILLDKIVIYGKVSQITTVHTSDDKSQSGVISKNTVFDVIVEGNRILLLNTGSRYRFCLPRGTEVVRLVSRTGCPAHQDKDNEDFRTLGIAVRSILLDGKPLSLDGPHMRSGWHEREPGWRWTDGDAVLVVAGGSVLEIEIELRGQYWLLHRQVAWVDSGYV